MKYTPSEVEIAFRKVIGKIEKGKPLGQILDEDGMPSRTSFYSWLENCEGYSERYARACELRADAIFEEIIEIADDNTRDTNYGENGNTANAEWINRSRVRIDARKWVLSKMAPKKYGDKIDITSGNETLAMPAVIGMVIKNEITQTSDDTEEPSEEHDDLF